MICRRFNLSLLFFGLIALGSKAQAQLINIGSDVKPNTVQKGIENLLASHTWHWLAAGIRWIADFLSLVLQAVYGFLSQGLLVVLDFTNPSTYGQAGMNTVANLTHIFQYIGFILLLVTFIFFMARMALGLNNQTVTIFTVVRLILPTFLLLTWPYIVSWMANLSTYLAIYLYSQNPVTVNNVFAAVNTSGSTLAATNPNISAPPFGNYLSAFLDQFIQLKLVAVAIGTLFCVFGMIHGLIRMDKGREGGLKIFVGALTCLFFIYWAPSLISYFATNGGGAFVAHPLASSGVPPLNGPSGLPQGVTSFSNATINSAPITPAPTPGPNTFATGPGQPQPQYDPNIDTVGNIINSILRVFVSLWGVFICFSILIAKGYQLIMIFILFFLGFPAIGLLGHPSTEHIPVNALKVFIKYHLYGPIWALVLVAMNILTLLNWGSVFSPGIGSFVSAFMILAGLTLIQNAQDVTALFSTNHGGQGGSASNFMRDGMSVIRTAASVVTGASVVGAAVSGQRAQGVASAIGSAAGSMAGGMFHPSNFVGTRVGSAIGSHVATAPLKALNTVSNSIQREHGGLSTLKPQMKSSINTISRALDISSTPRSIYNNQGSGGQTPRPPSTPNSKRPSLGLQGI